MDVTLKKVTAWIGAIATGLVVSTIFGTAVVASYDWFSDADLTHIVVAENKTNLERVTDILEGMRDQRCFDLVRHCMEKAKAASADPLPCLEIQCVKDSGPDGG